VLFTKYYYGNYIKDIWKGGISSKHGEAEEFVKNFSRKSEGKTPLGKLGSGKENSVTDIKRTK
jgi:hypothetical protein